MPLFPSDIELYKAMLGVTSLPLAWSERDLADLGIRGLHSLRRDRVKGGGIRFIKDKGQITYPVREVLEWMHTNTRASTSEYK